MPVLIKRYWQTLTKYLKPQWYRVVVLALLLLTSTGLQLVNPQILRSFIDQALSGNGTQHLLNVALLFVGLALLNQVLLIGATYVSENVAWTATNGLRADLAAHCLKLDLSFHKSTTPGEIIERIDGDVTTLSNFFSQFVIEIVSNFVLLVGVLIMLFQVDWRVGAILSIFMLCGLALLIRLEVLAVPYWGAQREITGKFYGFLGEELSGTADVRANGATGYVMRRLHEFLQSWFPIARSAKLAGYAMWIASLVVFALNQVLAFGLGAYLWSLGSVTIGTVYLIFNYTEMLQNPIHRIRTQLEDLQLASASIQRIDELLQTEPKLRDGAGRSLPRGPLSVELEHVRFGYEADKLALDDISFSLRPGQVLGLLGRTGCGKTTIARLLVRLYDPGSGMIKLGGVSLNECSLHDVRRQVGLVTQDVQLFAASVRDNLTFFNPSIADDRIIAVLEDLGLGGWYRSLPAGLDTVLEGSGSGVSGGQAQLLAFARLFLLDPGLVILDEASSRLDPATELLVERAINKLLQGRTAIIIAHRLATVERADHILILQRGQMLEYGDRERLANNPDSRFSSLLRTGIEEVLA